MLTINVNGNLGNQEVVLSDNTVGTLTGARVFGSQWVVIKLFSGPSFRLATSTKALYMPAIS